MPKPPRKVEQRRLPLPRKPPRPQQKRPPAQQIVRHYDAPPTFEEAMAALDGKRNE